MRADSLFSFPGHFLGTARWDSNGIPPFTNCHKPLHGAPTGDCPAHCPWPSWLWLRYVDLCDLATWTGEARLFSWAPQHTRQEHQVHCGVWEGEQASIPRCPGDQDRLTTCVYRKPTHLDCYIPFQSHHRQRTVTGVIRCMQDRANKICDIRTEGVPTPPSRLSTKWFPGWAGEEDALTPDPPHPTSTCARRPSRTTENHVLTLHLQPQ